MHGASALVHGAVFKCAKMTADRAIHRSGHSVSHLGRNFPTHAAKFFNSEDAALIVFLGFLLRHTDVSCGLQGQAANKLGG